MLFLHNVFPLTHKHLLHQHLKSPNNFIRCLWEKKKKKRNGTAGRSTVGYTGYSCSSVMGGAERYLVHRSLIFFTDLGFGMDQIYDLMIILSKYFQRKATPGHGPSYKMLLHTATFLLKTISAPLILEAQFMVCQVHSLQYA